MLKPKVSCHSKPYRLLLNTKEDILTNVFWVLFSHTLDINGH